MATLLDTDHRCHTCKRWRCNWHLCSCRPDLLAREPALARVLLTSSYFSQGTISISQEGRGGIDQDFVERFGKRYNAVLEWWFSHIGGPYNEDHVVAVALEYENIPTREIISILNRTLSRARNKPFSLRYFKVALEEGRGAYFKRQDSGSRDGRRSNAELVAEIVKRAQAQGGAENRG